MTYRDQLLAEMGESIARIREIAEDFDRMARETREFIDRHEAYYKAGDISRPEARAHLGIVK